MYTPGPTFQIQGARGARLAALPEDYAPQPQQQVCTPLGCDFPTQGGRGARLAAVPEDDALQPQQLEQAQEGLEAVAAARRAHQQVVRARRQQVQQEVAACLRSWASGYP